MSEDAKKGVLEEISRDLNPLFKNFLKLLVDKGRVGFIDPSPAALSRTAKTAARHCIG
jgi:F0F1-type ATP synthase delta subunit